MEFLTLWIAFAVIGIVATISPGPAFAMTVRIAVSNSRKVGIIFALGLGAGIAVQVSSILLGMGVIIAQSVFLFNLIKYAGAAYLIYIGAAERDFLEGGCLRRSRSDVCIEATWFSILAIFLTNPAIKAKFTAIAHWVERTCGGLLIALGVKLAVSKV